MRAVLHTLLRSFSLGTGVITVLALASALTLLARPVRTRPGLDMWIFSPEHEQLYAPVIEAREHTDEPDVNVSVIGIPALQRRMMSGFFAGLATSDLIEVERQMAGQAFTGPLDSVGFLDLTDRLRDEGLLDKINAPSFGPWTSRGRIFGLPHDVHPVLLGYRADIVEAAGIDVSTIETWDDFYRVMRPLMTDEDGDAQPDRYPFALWETDGDRLETLLYQAGGSFFDENDRPRMDTDLNARVLAEMISWCVGPDRVAADVPDFTAAGNKLKLDGYAIAYLMPDWMCNIWRLQLPQLAGKVKVMPLPAWEPGGKRTSVWGGTMIGIPKTSERVEDAWKLAKDLYLSEEIARKLYTLNDIVTPIKTYWGDPMFDEPDEYFSGQAKGRMYVDMAPLIPHRSSSPYAKLALDRFRDAAVALAEWARATHTYEPEAMLSKCHEELARAEGAVRRQMDRNVFLASDESGGDEE
ncbi:MAG: extracellular solute-binding protein [Phycisphaerales bacterium]